MIGMGGYGRHRVGVVLEAGWTDGWTDAWMVGWMDGGGGSGRGEERGRRGTGKEGAWGKTLQ